MGTDKKVNIKLISRHAFYPHFFGLVQLNSGVSKTGYCQESDKHKLKLVQVRRFTLTLSFELVHLNPKEYKTGECQ